MGGSSSSSSSSSTPVEAPNTLISNTRIKIVDLIGEGEIAGFWPTSGTFGSDPKTSVYFDDVPLLNGDGSANFNVSGAGFAFNYTVGSSGQSAIPNFSKVETLIPLSANTRIANPPPGAGPYKTVVTSFNSSTYPDADSTRITVRVPSLLSTDNDGNTNKYTITYAIDISTNGGEWATMKTETINGKCTSPYYKTTTITLPKPNAPQPFYSWKIRVRRVSENILSIRTNNEIFVDTISIISANSFSYPHSALVALELSADQFGNIPSRAYEIKGIKVQVPEGYTPTEYDVDGTITAATYPDVWLGNFSETRLWTDNPAWILYDLCTNDVYGLGNYIREEWIDKWTLYQIAQECDELVDDGKGGLEPKFTCNIAIQNQQSAYDLLMELVSVFRGMLYWANGRLFPVSNDVKAPIYNVTNANVVDGNFNYSDTARNTRSTVAVVRWLDPTNSYRESVEYVEDTDGISRYGYIQKEFASFATISKGQAIRAANWLLTTERLSTETITFQTAQEGTYFRPGDIFNVFDNFRSDSKQGGRVVNFNSARNSIELDKLINYNVGDTYSLSLLIPNANIEATGAITGSNQFGLMRNSQIETKTVTSFDSNYIDQRSILTVGSSFSAGLYKGSVFILNNETNTGINPLLKRKEYRCLATAEIEDGVFEVLGVEYFTGVNFQVATGYSSITNPSVIGDDSIPEPPSGLVLDGITGLLSDNTFFENISLTWSGSASDPAYYRISGSITGGDPYLITTTQNTGYYFVDTLTGTHTFYVGAVSNGGIESTYISDSYFVNTGNPLGNPPELSGVYILTNRDESVAPTGYINRSFVAAWSFATGINGTEPAGVQFLSGFKFHLLDPATDTDLVDPVTISDSRQRTFEISGQMISGAGQRDLKIYIETADTYGVLASGASLIVNNPPPNPPTYTSFYAGGGGLNYIITPDPNVPDTSGIYIWIGEALTPRFDNAYFTGLSTAGFVSHGFEGDYEIYYALTDSYGTGDCVIYGPVSESTTIGVTGIKTVGNNFIGNGVQFSGIGPVSLHQNGQTITISGVENPPVYTQNYTTATRTVDNYSPNDQSSAYAGLETATADPSGFVFASVADLNALRVAYETLEASHNNLLQVVTAMIDDDQSNSLKR